MDLGMVTGKMYVGIPYAMLEPIRSLLQAGYQPANLEADRRWVERLIERIKEAPVTIRVELGKAKITLRELLELKKGDVIKLNAEPDEDSAIVFVQDIPKFKGILGKYGESKAVMITKKVETEKDVREEFLKKIII
jgi:flagellar motor switch protein FliM